MIYGAHLFRDRLTLFKTQHLNGQFYEHVLRSVRHASVWPNRTVVVLSEAPNVPASLKCFLMVYGSVSATFVLHVA